MAVDEISKGHVKDGRKRKNHFDTKLQDAAQTARGEFVALTLLCCLRVTPKRIENQEANRQRVFYMYGSGHAATDAAGRQGADSGAIEAVEILIASHCMNNELGGAGCYIWCMQRCSWTRCSSSDEVQMRDYG